MYLKCETASAQYSGSQLHVNTMLSTSFPILMCTHVTMVPTNTAEANTDRINRCFLSQETNSFSLLVEQFILTLKNYNKPDFYQGIPFVTGPLQQVTMLQHFFPKTWQRSNLFCLLQIIQIYQIVCFLFVKLLEHILLIIGLHAHSQRFISFSKLLEELSGKTFLGYSFQF